VECLKKFAQRGKEKSLTDLMTSAGLSEGNDGMCTASQQMQADLVDDPYPLHQRPIQTLLTYRATIETAALRSGARRVTRQSVLAGPGSIPRLVSSDDIEPLPVDMDVDSILYVFPGSYEVDLSDLKPRLSAAKAAEIMESRKRTHEAMKRAVERYGDTIQSAAVWKEWDVEFARKMQVSPVSN
jgi:hypothetical protein